MRQVQPETLPKNSNFSSCLQNIKLKNNTTYNSSAKHFGFLAAENTMNENVEWQMTKDSVLFALSSGFSVSSFHFYLKKISTRGVLFCGKIGHFLASLFTDSVPFPYDIPC
jgi:hypothetical protein